MIEIPNFGYIHEERVAGSAHPGRGERLIETLKGLREEGFTGILSVLERPLESAPLQEFDLDSLHLAVRDFDAPTSRQIDDAVAFIDRHSASGRVLVHCLMGYGRTGTILACWLASRGRSADEAVREVRRLRPGSIEDRSQEIAIAEYARRLERARESRGKESE